MFGLGQLGAIGFNGGLLDPFPWALSSGGVQATLDIDFVNNLAKNGTAAPTIASLLTCTRATPSNATYTNAAGAISYFAADTLRYGDNGLLVEESRANLALQASDFTNASWTKSNMTTAKTATGPDGVANSASTLTASAGNATALQAITSGSAARITSVYLKRRTGTGNIDLTQDNGSTWATKVITSSWVRYEIASVTSTNPTVGIRIVTSTDAVDVFIFQHELGAIITSPIPTTTVAVTRAADDVACTGSNFSSWYNTSEGTFYNAIQLLAFAASTQVSLTAGASGSTDGDFSVRMSYANNPFVQLVSDNGGSQAQLQFNGIAATSPTRAAMAYKANDFAGSVNGVTPLTDASGSIFTPDRLFVGVAFNVYYLNGYITRLAYWNSRLSNANLQTLTT
jgi:hypothetical protein